MTMPAAHPPPEPTAKSTAARHLAAHLDVSTLVTGAVGFLLVLLVNRGIQNLDTLTHEVSRLNSQVAVILAKGETQAKKDEEQDRRLDKHHERLREVEDLAAALKRRPH